MDAAVQTVMYHRPELAAADPRCCSTLHSAAPPAQPLALFAASECGSQHEVPPRSLPIRLVPQGGSTEAGIRGDTTSASLRSAVASQS